MKNNKLFTASILLALVCGGILGLFSFPFIHHSAQIMGELFLNMLKLISLPLIFLATISTLTKMTSLKEAKIFLKKTLKYTLITTLIAATVGCFLFVTIRPTQSIENLPSFQTPVTSPYLSFLIKIIPPNLIQPFLENNALGAMFIATLSGIAIISLPSKQAALLRDFFEALFDMLLKITSILIVVIPIGVLSFTILFVKTIQEGNIQIQQFLLYGACVIGANLLQGFCILPLILKLRGASPKFVIRGAIPALTMAFFSKSSSATLPLTINCAKNRLKISDKTANFTLPLCSVINMNGCAAFILITIFFVCTSHGMTFTPWIMIFWIVISTCVAIGNAGVPMGCFFLTTALLVGMGVPIAIMGMILPLYFLFDMIETTLNVWSDICITTLVDREISRQPPLT